MSEANDDGLWPYFAPFWKDLRAISPATVLAGGYGLFLKQKWLLAKQGKLVDAEGRRIVTSDGTGILMVEEPTLVEISRWSSRVPRATKDFDFIVSLDLIASEEDQRRLTDVLRQHQFSEVPENKRWQFERKVGGDQSIKIDFHSPEPDASSPDVRMEKRRVKHKRSLGNVGIHGRVHAEVYGADLHPFVFQYLGAEITLPNPVTFAVMKLLAARDRRAAAQDATKAPEILRFEGRQSDKHAEDLIRVIAMMTRKENDSTGPVLDVLRGTQGFIEASRVYREHFSSEGQWGYQVAYRDGWSAEDLASVRQVLSSWFIDSKP